VSTAIFQPLRWVGTMAALTDQAKVSLTHRWWAARRSWLGFPAAPSRPARRFAPPAESQRVVASRSRDFAWTRWPVRHARAERIAVGMKDRLG
jgi:hypothetical protein